MDGQPTERKVRVIKRTRDPDTAVQSESKEHSLEPVKKKTKASSPEEKHDDDDGDDNRHVMDEDRTPTTASSSTPVVTTTLNSSRDRPDLNLTRDETTDQWNQIVHSGKNCRVTLYLKRLGPRLIEYIDHPRTKFVVGCVAWLTNMPVLEALANKAGCSFIVQDGGFKDAANTDEPSGYHDRLRKSYEALKPLQLLGITPGAELLQVVPKYSMLLNTKRIATPFAVRVAGSVESNSVQPRMHHKFALFLDDHGIPFGVWTGSFNWTNCASKSFENATFIQDHDIVQGYFAEFLQMLIQSRELTWQ